MVGRWWGSAWSCTRWETAPAWCPSASWWLLYVPTVREDYDHSRTGGWFIHTRQVVAIRQSLIDKLSLYFHTTHFSFVTFLKKGSNYIIRTTHMDVAFNHLSTFEDYQTKITNWGAKLIWNYSTKHKSFISANDMLRLTVGSDFTVTETKTEIFFNITAILAWIITYHYAVFASIFKWQISFFFF